MGEPSSFELVAHSQGVAGPSLCSDNRTILSAEEEWWVFWHHPCGKSVWELWRNSVPSAGCRGPSPGCLRVMKFAGGDFKERGKRPKPVVGASASAPPNAGCHDSVFNNRSHLPWKTEGIQIILSGGGTPSQGTAEPGMENLKHPKRQRLTYSSD